MEFRNYTYVCICAATCLLYFGNARALDTTTLTYLCCPETGCTATASGITTLDWACSRQCSSCYVESGLDGSLDGSISGTTDTVCLPLVEHNAAGEWSVYPCHTTTEPDNATVSSLETCTYANNNPEVSCYPGYYLYPDTETCKPCPKGMTSEDYNRGDVTSCYYESNADFSNTIGEFSFASACYCDDSCEDGCSPESSSC